ncbi:MAG: hypothetical protein RLZZ453_198 [Chlamydiota bacterium]|jgi:hypothetical protein
MLKGGYQNTMPKWLILLLPFAAHTLETRPWFHQLYEFDFETRFAYRHFSKVEGASVQLRSPLNDRELRMDMGFTPYPLFDVRAELEFAQVGSINWSFQSAALQSRLGIWDDIVGDPVSITVGVDIRGVNGHLLKSVAVPYASEFNLELTCSCGKEWATGAFWRMHTYGFLAVGQGNRGYPWTRGSVVFQYNLLDTHRFTLFTDGLFGFGGKQHVDVDHFHGWAPFQHQSIDVGGAYGYHLGVYGTLTLTYSYRIFAHNFPEGVQSGMLAYTIPFCLF